MIVSDFYSATNIARWRKRDGKVSRVNPKQSDVRSRKEINPQTEEDKQP